MALIRLASRARHTLEQVARSSADGRQVRRAQVLLWLHGGASPDQVAERSGLTRQAIYDIVHRYQVRKGQPVRERIQDYEHTGRPPDKVEPAARVIHELLQQSPKRYHYRSPIWTAPMLRCQTQRRLRSQVSLRTVRRALHRLRQRYKRPRLVLAARPATWRQAKGGSNAA